VPEPRFASNVIGYAVSASAGVTAVNVAVVPLHTLFGCEATTLTVGVYLGFMIGVILLLIAVLEVWQTLQFLSKYQLKL
jgi:ABC-type nickel/cobalt efflux system permease component RcnA